MINKLIHNSNKTSKTYNKEGENNEVRDTSTSFINHFIDLGYNLSQNILSCSRKTELYILTNQRGSY